MRQEARNGLNSLPASLSYIDEMAQIEVHDGVSALSQELLALYGEVFAEAPYNDTQADIDEFAAGWPELVSEPGFRLVLARADSGEPAGFALGHALAPGTAWWCGLREPGYGVAELGVRGAYRRQGIARGLHDALIHGRPERQIVLWARPAADVARAVYATWGYRQVDLVTGPKRTNLVLCLDKGVVSVADG